MHGPVAVQAVVSETRLECDISKHSLLYSIYSLEHVRTASASARGAPRSEDLTNVTDEVYVRPGCTRTVLYIKYLYFSGSSSETMLNFIFDVGLKGRGIFLYCYVS